ncbi:hypothetical protein Mal4_47980 [Maioricimonas rarisocia]|uniref:Double-GTPase 1 domain-containing protein n=1 Tax=Maioricimonas rarisocia TaxID=2528026 RepID=A0A517ZDA5_9PLAN|nr:hypothetical protein [Maioricimonas rarisocia]QDU40441.1 hypothetical protein Mal4_47980 [Maioricimonas rarisocia]
MTQITTETPKKTESIRCVCCQQETPDRGGFCMNCEGPLDVTRAVHDRGTPARFVSVLGSSGAGKTVYLGVLLDMLSKGSQSLRGLPNGAFSVAVQQQTIHSLQSRQFPEKTPTESDSWRWVHCEVSHEKRPKRLVDIVTPDFAGEAIALETEHENTFPIIRSIVSQSEGMLLLFDSHRARDFSRDEDFFAMKLVSYIARVRGKRWGRRVKKVRSPVAVVYTKADSCPEAMGDPREFAAATMPGLVQACKRHFSRHEFFATGVVGSCVTAVDPYQCTMNIPLHVEPRGVIEPLEWIVQQM